MVTEEIVVGFLQKKILTFLRTKCDGAKARVFRNTVLQGLKRGMPSVTPEFIEETARKHAATLSKVGETPGAILDYIEQTTSKLFKRIKEENFHDLLEPRLHTGVALRRASLVGVR